MKWYFVVPIILLCVLVLAFVVHILLSLLTMPGKRNSSMEKYKSQKFAHRGLHDNLHAENSLSAFRLAKEHNFGIELDIRLSKDGQLVVFHDANMKRVCGVNDLVVNHTVDELHNIKLSGTEEGIPTFREVLDLIDGAVPILVEIKMEGKEKGISERFLEEIKGYHGDFIVESFNPIALRIVKKGRPDILRGILSMEFHKEEKYRGKLLYKLLETLNFNFLSRPDFIAYEKGGYKVKNLRSIRRDYETPLFAWTIRSAEEEKDAISRGFDTVIFENYVPEK